ncbi:hypothetical protein BLS_009001 [Venturia inaequalis]|uniref:Uncharacterized protein n=1 Tax=Venturia inaequalis TaxID=5025 RepID=A0A8H3U555_VENIN|nr:hypothetical protein BLS_009001 [Venturia inaequalis]
MPVIKQDHEQASSLAQAFTDLYRLGRQSVNQGDFPTAKRCFEQLVEKQTPSSFFGSFEEGLPGPDDKPTSTFVLYNCSIIEPDGTETFAENCTFVIDACQRLAQLPNISCDQAAEYLEIAGKRIDYAVKDADIAPAIRAAIEPFKDRNEELKDEVQRRSEEQLLIVVENGQRRMQEAMVTGQDVFDQSYNTMNSGQFGTVAQGFMQDTLSFPARVPELVPDPVQLYTDSSAILSNQTTSNDPSAGEETENLPPATESPTVQWIGDTDILLKVQVPFPNTPDPGPSSGTHVIRRRVNEISRLWTCLVSRLRYNLDLIRMEMGDRLDLIKITDSLNLIKMGDRLDSIKITDSLDLIKITDSLHSIIITDSLDLIKITDSLNSIKITDSLDLIKITDNLNSIKITDNLNSVKITDSLNSIKMGDRLDLIKIADSLNSIKITDNLNSINSIR